MATVAACQLFFCQVQLRRGHTPARHPCLRPRTLCLQGGVASQCNCCVQKGQPLPPAERGQPALARRQLQGGRVRAVPPLELVAPAWCPAVLSGWECISVRLEMPPCLAATPGSSVDMSACTQSHGPDFLRAPTGLPGAPLLVFAPQKAKGGCLLSAAGRAQHWAPQTC